MNKFKVGDKVKYKNPYDLVVKHTMTIIKIEGNRTIVSCSCGSTETNEDIELIELINEDWDK